MKYLSFCKFFNETDCTNNEMIDDDKLRETVKLSEMCSLILKILHIKRGTILTNVKVLFAIVIIW